MHEEAIRKADILIEAMGFIRKFHGKFTVIKLGGSVMEDPESLRALLVDVVFMQTVGMRPVIVHDAGNRKAGGYFSTVNGTENSVFSQTMLKTPPLEGSLETAIVN